MKKLALTIVLLATAVLGNNSLNAQNRDAFFDSKSSSSTTEYRTEESTLLPMLPRVGGTDDQNAPVGSGLAILTGLGLGYLAFRKKD